MPFGRRKQTSDQSEPVRRFEFVGREKELKIFFDNLYLPADAPSKKPIVSISGIGGIGKTRFLKHVMQELSDDSIISFVDETDNIGDDIGTLISAIVGNIRKSGKPINLEKTEGYIRRRNELLAHLQAAKDELPKGFFELIFSAAKLAINTTPAGPIFDLVASEGKVAEVLSALGNRLLGKRNEKVDYALLFEPKQILTRVFVEDMNRVGQGNECVVLIFDTYEATGSYLNPWILKYLIGNERDAVECNLHVVMGGRNPLSKTDQGWHQWNLENLILDIVLDTFSDTEIHEYLKKNHKDEEIDIERLAHLTYRIPLWLEVWSLSGKSLAEYQNLVDMKNITDRILKFLPSEKHRSWVRTAALYRSFDRDTLAVILEDEATIAFDWMLSQHSFVKVRSQDNRIQLHDEMYSLIGEYQKKSSPETWSKEKRLLADYYLAKANKRSHEMEYPNFRVIDAAFQDAVIEFYYYAFQSTDVHFIIKSELYGFLLEALQYNLPFFYRLSDLIENYNENENASVKLPDIRASWVSKDIVAFRLDLIKISENYSLTPSQIAIAYNWLGYASALDGETSEALEYYNKSIELNPNNPANYFDRSIIWAQLKQESKSQSDILKGKELRASQISQAFGLLTLEGNSSNLEELDVSNMLADDAGKDEVLKLIMKRGELNENVRVNAFENVDALTNAAWLRYYTGFNQPQKNLDNAIKLFEQAAEEFRNKNNKTKTNKETLKDLQNRTHKKKTTRKKGK